MLPFDRERFAPGNGIDLPPVPDDVVVEDCNSEEDDEGIGDDDDGIEDGPKIDAGEGDDVDDEEEALPLPNDVEVPDQVVDTFGERLMEPVGVLLELVYAVVVLEEQSSPGEDSMLS